MSQPTCTKEEGEKVARHDYITAPNRVNYKVKRAYFDNSKPQFAETVIMVVDSHDKEKC